MVVIQQLLLSDKMELLVDTFVQRDNLTTSSNVSVSFDQNQDYQTAHSNFDQMTTKSVIF